MYERLSARANRVVKLAHDIAREYDQEYVGTEHILLAILREGTGVAVQLLERHDITASKLKDQVDQLVKRSAENLGIRPSPRHTALSQCGHAAIEQARQLESKEVCTEHLLLALLREQGSVAHAALKNLDLDHAKARQTLLELCPET